MRTYLIINERTARRRFREHELRKRPLTVLGWDLSAFGFRIAADDTRTFFVRVARRLGAVNVLLGTVGELTAAEARAKALAEIETARAERATDPLMADFADEFMRLMPAFGRLRLAAIEHARVSAWFDAASATRPGAANRAFEILRAMLKTARQWGELGENVPDARANIVMNQRRLVARYLNGANSNASVRCWTDTGTSIPGR